MIRKGTYPIEQVLDHVIFENLPKEDPRRVRVYDGMPVKMDSHRYRCFKTHGVKCVECGLTGKYFAIEQHADSDLYYHFNLYATNDQGQEILMTKDHVTPKSKGGKDSLENYRTMCEPCNKKKGCNSIALGELQLSRLVLGQLKTAIEAHGPIGPALLESATKRVVKDLMGYLRNEAVLHLSDNELVGQRIDELKAEIFRKDGIIESQSKQIRDLVEKIVKFTRP